MSDNCCGEEKSSCCSSDDCCTEEVITQFDKSDKWIVGKIETSKGAVPTISTSLSFKDILGACKVRFGIGRMNYKINPGLYAIGNPNKQSPVFVSANYKLTFDTLRKNLSDIECWILILDTNGVNVWCAAGKGTFGTDELVNRIEETGLSEIVAHRRLILPQLGASGVNSNEVVQQSGFFLVFGTVRASDIKQFIADDFKATQEMRTVKFTLWDRIVLMPVELVAAIKISLLILGVLFIINLFAARQFDVYDFTAYAGAVLVGTVVTPTLLPIIPGKAFSWKGWLLGLCWTVFALWIFGWFSPGFWLLSVGYLLLLPSVSAYLAMNFTGSSTYTSPSGVLKEMKIALPLIIGSSAVGAVLVLIKNLFI
ncbi:acetyl-CoA synthase subunit gamma [Lachnospiraceae bacterium ZAX-1]